MKCILVFILGIQLSGIAQERSIPLERKNLDYSYNEQIEEHVIKIRDSVFISDFLRKNEELEFVSYEKKETFYEENVVGKFNDLGFYADTKFLIFENDNVQETLLIWRLEGERTTSYYFFILDEKDNFYKLGDVNLAGLCHSPSNCIAGIPDEIIEVSKNNSSFEILFKEKIYFSLRPVSAFHSKKGGRAYSENLTFVYFW